MPICFLFHRARTVTEVASKQAILRGRRSICICLPEFSFKSDRKLCKVLNLSLNGWCGNTERPREAGLSLFLICEDTHPHTDTHSSHICYRLDLLQRVWISKPVGVKPSIIPPSCFFSLLMTLEATIGEKFVFIVTLKVKPFYSQNRKNRGTTGSLAVYIEV